MNYWYFWYCDSFCDCQVSTFGGVIQDAKLTWWGRTRCQSNFGRVGGGVCFACYTEYADPSSGLVDFSNRGFTIRFLG